MAVIRVLTGAKTSGRPKQFLILQNRKRRAITCLRFLFPPMPQFTQNRGSAAAQRARSTDSPHLVWFASAIAGGLFERALTRLPKPLHSADRRQFLLHLPGQPQQIVSVIDGVG